MNTSLTDRDRKGFAEELGHIGAEVAHQYPGESPRRQPVHTIYGGAHLFRADTVNKLGMLALRSMEQFAPTTDDFAKALKLPGDHAFHTTIYERVIAKLKHEPVEDFRIDFEDGYGHRPDADEDACAVATAVAVADGLEAATLSPFVGIRVKPFNVECSVRAVRTLDLFITTLADRAASILDERFVVTIPKITDVRQIAVVHSILTRLEERLELKHGVLAIELMIETTQSIFDSEGRSSLRDFVTAAGGRCRAAHFGVYDYTAGCSITAQHQNMTHPACDFARHMMQVALGGSGVALSDGATNIMPIAPHSVRSGKALTDQQRAENRQSVHHAWRQHYDDVSHSLRHAYYQGWDLNPGQLPTRYAAVYAFFLRSLESASQRLRNFVDMAAQATLVGDVFDDAATGQGLLNFFLRGMNCGAITETEVQGTGLSAEELRSRSFAKIVASRGGS